LVSRSEGRNFDEDCLRTGRWGKYYDIGEGSNRRMKKIRELLYDFYSTLHSSSRTIVSRDRLIGKGEHIMDWMTEELVLYNLRKGKILSLPRVIQTGSGVYSDGHRSSFFRG
jgi:hypothetical protein